MKKFFEVSIQSSPSGFGEYQCAPINGEGWADACDLINEIEGNVGEIFELGKGELPEDIPNISGRIQDEPARVFAYREGDQIVYFGISG